MWVGYSYTECVLCSGKTFGELKEKSDKKDIRWVQCTEGAGNQNDAAAYGGPMGYGGFANKSSNAGATPLNMALCMARALAEGGGKSQNDEN